MKQHRLKKGNKTPFSMDICIVKENSFGWHRLIHIKESHWILCIFPQLKQLGRSSTAQYFGIENLEEATEYLNHQIFNLQKLKDIFLYTAKELINIAMEKGMNWRYDYGGKMWKRSIP